MRMMIRRGDLSVQVYYGSNLAAYCIPHSPPLSLVIRPPATFSAELSVPVVNMQSYNPTTRHS